MATATCAALCDVAVSQDVLDRDLVLHLILKTVKTRTHQLSLKITKKPKDALTLSLADGSVLSNRRAILRSLAGAALHGAMDLKFGWLSANADGNQYAVATITEWMKLAADLASGEAETIEKAIGSCEKTLLHSAFLVPYTSACTLADLDMAIALIPHLQNRSISPQIARWVHQTGFTLKQLAKDSGVELNVEFPSPPPRPNLPIFFDGTEDVDETLSQIQNRNNAGGKVGGVKTKAQGEQDSGKQKSKKEAKKDKKKESAPKAKVAETESASYDISALDIRVGKIIKVWPHESADKLFCEEIDLGNEEIRQIASGLRPFYKESDMQDRVVLVLCNLKKRNLVGFPSHGMVLCASNADHTAVEFVVPPDGTNVGERVLFEGISPDVAPEPENKVAKKKIFEQLAPDLKTNEAGHVVWKTHVAKTSAGIVQALNKMPGASVS